MLRQIHRSHIGIEGCLRRAREVLYWPLMNSEVKDFVSKCSICQSYQPDQCREELQPYPIPSRPWSMLGADFFDLGQQGEGRECREDLQELDDESESGWARPTVSPS